MSEGTNWSLSTSAAKVLVAACGGIVLAFGLCGAGASASQNYGTLSGILYFAALAVLVVSIVLVPIGLIMLLFANR